MTDAEILKYYVDLLILQYRGKAKARAEMGLEIDPIVMNQVKLSVLNGFNVDTAVGAQLDILGEYVGISRVAQTFTSPVTLTDTEYRLLIKIKLLQNHSGSSLYDINLLLFQYFNGAIQAFDNADMSMGYEVDSLVISPTLIEVLVRQDLLPRPMGVRLSPVIYFPGTTTPFGFRRYSHANPSVTGFNYYADYQDHHWISYADGIA